MICGGQIEYSRHMVYNLPSYIILYLVRPPCYDGQVQLGEERSGNDENGDLFYEGRVEVCINETFGVICDDGWDEQDAAVACNSMGRSPQYYSKLLYLYKYKLYYLLQGYIHVNLLTLLSLSVTRCRGTEWITVWSVGWSCLLPGYHVQRQ